jgi:hypothetical protein
LKPLFFTMRSINPGTHSRVKTVSIEEALGEGADQGRTFDGVVAKVDFLL